MIAGIEGLHAWTPPGAEGSAVTLGERRDAEGNLVWPRFVIRRISGLRSAGEPEDNRDSKVGAIGETPRRSERRGKSVVYEGTIKARTLKELREAEDTLQAAFADITAIGRMGVSWHPTNAEFAEETPKFYEAKCLTCDIPDNQETKSYDRLFVVGLRMYDPRHFDAEEETHTTETAKTDTKYDF